MEKKEVVANEETTYLHTERQTFIIYIQINFPQINSRITYKVRGLFNYLSESYWKTNTFSQQITTLGAHRLLFLSFSLKQWRQSSDGCRYKRWIWVVQVIESKKFASFLEISRYPLQVFHIPNVRRFYLNYFGHMNHIQRKDEGEKFLNELFSVSRGFFPFRCVWWWPIWLFPYFILFWIRRAL